ncbi:hypothetical protein [Wolbachia endosymbiont (group B) of Camptogramma bilineatum]|uniref:hypothetical protein n=1 Tax=Wolbachia endosymbiont (group B) of Camptogramma bilineatum TaxID=2953991 RepID=UPI002232A85A|nr:hypothetical protein [Wolbachia endosymbiont (group B) of Camptogramma bilineatum]
MIGNVKKLSNEAPIILTWVPRVYGASLPDGKNSDFNYLEIITNHKSKNKEERDIYLVINGPGFEENQIDYLKHALEDTKGVHVIDLHQYDWSEIDTGWKIDGEDISIKEFFENMYNMEEKQRMYFAVEIDTFRLVALALLKQFTGHEGGIYIDFDSLKAIDSHIGKDITIPEGILLGQVTAHVNQETGKIIKTDLNNDLIAVSCPHIAINILSQYKSAILSQEKMCYELAERLSNFVKKEKLRFFAIYKGLGEKQLLDDEAKKKGKSVIEELDKIEHKIVDLRNGKIRELYDPLVCHYSRYREIGLNLGQFYTVEVVRNELIGQDESKLGLFFFEKNNGNYVCTINGDLSWMKGKDLYHERVDNKLEEAEVDQAAMEKLSLK